jgi:hypothetical protein
LIAYTISETSINADALMNAAIAYFKTFADGGLDSFSTHAVLIGVIAAAEFSLGIGIWLESPKNKTRIEWFGLILVLGGCVVSVIATVLLLIFDEGVSSRQNEEIIALRKNGIARSIEVSAFAARLADSPLASVEIRYVVPCTDCESLSFWLSEALKKANWSVSSITPIDPIDRNWVRVVGRLHAQSSGITVVVNSPDKISADRRTSSLAALMGALSQTLGFNFAGYDAAVMGGIDVSMPPDLIRVVIAPKA